jgi:copper homeostasis protein CutC
VHSFVAATGVREVHASLRGAHVFGAMSYMKPGVYMGGEKRNEGLEAEYANKYADEAAIRAVTGRAQSSAAE